MRTLTEPKRGCGFRKGGGLYLVTDPGMSAPCGKLPKILDVCPTCSGGIKFSRSWTWISPAALFERGVCQLERSINRDCRACVLSSPPERAGLLWIGEKFYGKPSDWIAEANTMGVSRRIPAVPNDFVAGETWVLVAHKKAVSRGCSRTAAMGCPYHKGQRCEVCKGTGYEHLPAIFHAFKPERIEYVVKGDETEEDLERLEKRGVEPVRVIPAGDPDPLPFLRLPD